MINYTKNASNWTTVELKIREIQGKQDFRHSSNWTTVELKTSDCVAFNAQQFF